MIYNDTRHFITRAKTVLPQYFITPVYACVQPLIMQIDNPP